MSGIKSSPASRKSAVPPTAAAPGPETFPEPGLQLPRGRLVGYPSRLEQGLSRRLGPNSGGGSTPALCFAGTDFDSGGVRLNWQLAHSLQKREPLVRLTSPRTYHEDDNAHDEQKNYLLR